MSTPLVFIASIINPTNDPLSYTNTRSVFTSEERFQQTLQSIASVKKYLPSARILFIEGTNISEEQTKIIQESVDYFFNCKDDPFAQQACLHSPNKGFGEAIQSYFAIQYIQSNCINFSKLFKLSGRYSFTEKFNVTLYSDEKFTFYKRASSNPLSISTVVYSVPEVLFENYSKAIQSTIETYCQQDRRGYEQVFPAFCNPREEIDEIGVEGLVSVNGEYFSC